MTRLFALFAALALAGCYAPRGVAAARVGFVQPPAATGCVYTGFSDGCAGANANGAFTFRSNYAETFAAYAQQSGQVWTSAHPWGWNAPGVDYPVGYDTTLALKDPATAALPTGCTYQANPWSTGNEVYCSVASGTIDFEGYDMSLHNCVVLQFGSANAASIIVKNNKWIAGSACRQTNGWMVLIQNSGASVTVSNNNFDDWSGSAPATAETLVTDNAANSATFVAEYNWFHDASNRAVTVNTPSVTLDYNVFDGLNTALNTGAHGEIGLPPDQTGSNYILSYNTVVFDTRSQDNTSGIYMSTGGTNILGTYQEDHNIIVSNLAGYVAGGPSGNVGGANFTGSVSGATLTVASGSVTGAIALGQDLHGTGVPANEQIVAGSGLSWTLSVSATVASESLQAIPQAAVSEVINELDSTPAAEYTTLTIEDNYADPTGALGCYYPFSGTPGALNFAGNISMTMGSAMNTFGANYPTTACQ